MVHNNSAGLGALALTVHCCGMWTLGAAATTDLAPSWVRVTATILAIAVVVGFMIWTISQLRWRPLTSDKPQLATTDSPT